jgi:hypothetical protein
MSFVREQSRGNLYRTLCETVARGTFVVSFVRQQLQGYLYCEFCETAGTDEPLL